MLNRLHSSVILSRVYCCKTCFTGRDSILMGTGKCPRAVGRPSPTPREEGPLGERGKNSTLALKSESKGRFLRKGGQSTHTASSCSDERARGTDTVRGTERHVGRGRAGNAVPLASFPTREHRVKACVPVSVDVDTPGGRARPAAVPSLVLSFLRLLAAGNGSGSRFPAQVWGWAAGDPRSNPPLLCRPSLAQGWSAQCSL